MLPTVPFSLLAGLLLGLVFAWAARRPLREARLPFGPGLRAVISYQVVIRWPVLLYFFLVHREWSFLEMMPASRLPASLLLLLLPLDAVALIGGYVGGWGLLRRWGEAGLRVACGTATAVVLGFIVALRHRVGRVAAPSDGRLLWVLTVVTIGAAAAAWEVYRTLRSESRRKANRRR